MAAAEASFKTSIDSMSLLFRKLMFVPTGMPSTTYKGSVPFTVVTPRIRTFGCAPGPPPLVT